MTVGIPGPIDSRERSSAPYILTYHGNHPAVSLQPGEPVLARAMPCGADHIPDKLAYSVSSASGVEPT